MQPAQQGGYPRQQGAQQGGTTVIVQGGGGGGGGYDRGSDGMATGMSLIYLL